MEFGTTCGFRHQITMWNMKQGINATEMAKGSGEKAEYPGKMLPHPAPPTLSSAASIRCHLQHFETITLL